MNCPACQHESPTDSIFCEACGRKLDRPCPSCGTKSGPAAVFCRKCGAEITGLAAEGSAVRDGPASPTREPLAPSPLSYTPKHLADKILQSKSALEGERKQVTVLFADVKGSMELAEQVDPEEWHKILDRFFAILTDGVHRFEGTVNQYTGDGIMALFGAPIAHEDHAQRACYAALSLRDELRRYADELRVQRGLSFGVRIGLNSGEVVVGKIGDDLRMDYTAQGHTVGLAARMEQIAEPGRVYLTHHTARLVEGFFQVRNLGRSQVKGIGEPVGIYELERVGPLRTRLEVAQSRGFSRFVGRDEETASVEAALTRAREGHGQVVGVVGEAGVGKSRLCYEFARRCRARGIPIYEAHGVAHGKAIPFLPVLEYLRGYFGIMEQDAEQVAREKMAGKLLLLDPDLTEALPLLFDFLGVLDAEHPAPRMDPEARQRQLFAAIRRLIHAQSRREPGVSVIEDLHWFDGGSEAFLENYVEALAGTRSLLVVNFRPEYHAGWMQKSYYEQLPLTPLGPEAIRELQHDLLGADPSLKGLAERIEDRTGGNPFFIEELVQGLVEAGTLTGTKGAYRMLDPVEQIAIPATVQAVLAARIDRLGDPEKAVLQTAAVIGKKFSEPVLEHVTELPGAGLTAALRALTAAEFIYEEALYPEAEYAFKHPLTQEVAYRSQLTEHRAVVHAAVARTVTELYPDKLDERAALLAHHWEGAGDRLEAARWHCRAAAWVGASDFAAALEHWRRVRALVKTLPESAETVQMQVAACQRMLHMGWRLGGSAEEAARLFADGKELATRAGDLRSLALLSFAYGAIQGFGAGGTMEDYIALSKEGMRFAQQTDDAGVRLEQQVNLIAAHGESGRLGEALAFAEDALAQAPDDPRVGAEVFGYCPSIVIRGQRGLYLTFAGRLGEAAHDLDRALALSREHGDFETLGFAHSAHATRARYTGDAGTAIDHARRAIECAEKIGSPFSRVWAYQVLGLAHLLNEQWAEALVGLEQALALARERRALVSTATLILVYLSEARLGCGDASGARAAAEEALSLARRRRQRGEECHAHLALARILLRVEGAKARSAIEDALRKAHALVEQTGAKIHEPFIHEERANLARLLGDEGTRQHELREAHRLFTEMGATGHAERIARELEAGG